MLNALLVGLAFAGLLLCLYYFRSKQNSQFEILVNQLMTKSPLYFLTSKASLAYPYSLFWNQLPHYLREHGYEVLVFKDFEDFKKANEKKEGGFHVFFSFSESEFASQISQNYPDQVQSMQLLISSHKYQKLNLSTEKFKNLVKIHEISLKPKFWARITCYFIEKLHSFFTNNKNFDLYALGCLQSLAYYEYALSIINATAEREWQA